ncbi:MAG TPA: GtrA family protein [Nocardioides sp.]|nr:GtrA family protein [Nocardioides sp.]
MSTARTETLRRHGRNALQFGRFALVGGTGVVVNLVVLVLVKRMGPLPEDAIVALHPTAFHVRWYHVYSTIAFLVANLWNFQLNRWWTFRSSKHSGWWREYWPFLAVGLLGQAIGLVLLTLLMHRGSPLSLPTGVLDDSSGFRTRLYWAQLIVIAVVTPLSFVLNKLWTFAAVRTHHLEAVPAHPAAERELEHLGVDETDGP